MDNPKQNPQAVAAATGGNSNKTRANYSIRKPRLSAAESLAIGLPKSRSDGGIGGYASGRKLRRAIAAMQRKGVK